MTALPVTRLGRLGPSGGPAYVLLHGFTGSAESWHPALASAPAGATVAALTLPGHGGDVPLATDFGAVVERIAATLRGAGLAPAHLVGYSLGARLALGLAVEAPDVVHALTLIGVNPGLDPDERRARLVADEAWATMLETEPIEVFVAAWEALPLWQTQRELCAEARAERRRIRMAHEPRGLGACLRATGLGAMPDYRAAFARLAVPVTLVTGALDTKFDRVARALVEARPATRHRVVAGVGHDVVLEAPMAAWGCA